MIKKLIFLPVLCVLQTSLLVAKTGEEQIDISGDNNVVNKTVSGDINTYNISSPMSTEIIEVKNLIAGINKKMDVDSNTEKRLSKSGVRIIFSEEKMSFCKNAETKNIYIKNNSVGRFEAAMYKSANLRAISRKESEIKIWRSDNSLLSGCVEENTWRRVSGVAPAKTNVVSLGANCLFHKPKDMNKRELQFVYYTGTSSFSHDGGDFYPWTGKMGYYESPEDYAKGNVKNIKFDKVGAVGMQITRSACMNIELNYCGDGILQPEHEQCDFEKNDSKNCSNICEIL